MKNKPARMFTMKDVDGEVIGNGKYYLYGGNIQIVWHKYTPGGGALQFYNIGEALLLKGVHCVEWDKEQEDEALLPDGWYQKIKLDDDSWDCTINVHGRTDLVVPFTDR